MQSTTSPRSSITLAIIVTLASITAGWTIYNAIQLFSATTRSWEIKIPLMISLTLLFLFSYAVFLIIYSKWANQTREMLISLLLLNPRVVYSKFNRYFIDEQIVNSLGYKSSTFKKLSQKDIKYAADNYLEWEKTLNKRIEL